MQSRAATAPAGGRAAGRQFLKSAEPSIFSSRHSPGAMTHAGLVGSVGSGGSVGSVDGASSAVGFGVLEREREDGVADSVTVTVGVGGAGVVDDPGSPPVRSAARATINPPMPARAPTISQWTRSRQDVRAPWAGLLLMKQCSPGRERVAWGTWRSLIGSRLRPSRAWPAGRLSVRARPLVHPAARPAEPRRGRPGRGGRRGTALRPAGAERARRRRCSTRTCPRGGL